MKLLLLLFSCAWLCFSDPEMPIMSSVTIGTQQVCPQYLCKTSSYKIGCATYQNEDVIMESCLSDWYCNWREDTSRSYQYGKCLLRRAHYKFRKNYGEYCYQNEDCKSYYCIQNKCSVKNQDIACENSYQCGKGLLCNPSTNTCQKWLANGASCSSQPTMCNPQSGCVSVDNALAVCTQYFSLTTNTLSVINSGFYGSGDSFFCQSANLANGINQCLGTSLKLSGTYPQTCTDYTKCPSSTDSLRYSSCDCYPNTQGVKYCFPFPGDIPETFTLAKEKAAKDFSICYNYEIMANMNGCGYLSLEEHRDWAPPIKAGTWGSCYDAVNMSVSTYVAISYTGSSSGTCPAIKCLDKGNNAEGYCFAYYAEAFLYYVQSCPSDYICGTKQNGDYTLATNNVLCKAVRPKSKHHKDESCWVDSDCFSGMCGINKYCTVYTQGSSCTSDNQCDRSMICRPSSLGSSSYTCQNWLNIGERCTTSTYYLCRPMSLCISSSNSDSGTCQGYYSVEGSATYYEISSIGAIQGYQDIMCKSGSFNSQTKVCFPEPDKLASYPLKCTANTDCKSTNYNSLGLAGSDGVCNCFPNTQGYNYCQVFSANIDADLYNWASTYFKRDLSNCFSYEIGAAYGGSCQLGSRYHDIWTSSVPSQYFPSCGKDVLYDEDRYASFQSQDLIFLYIFSERLIASIVLILGILLVK